MKVFRLILVVFIFDEVLLFFFWFNFLDIFIFVILLNVIFFLVGDFGLWLGVGVAEGVFLFVEIYSLDLVVVVFEINISV